LKVIKAIIIILRYTCVEGDCRTFLIVWGQPNSGAFIYLL